MTNTTKTLLAILLIATAAFSGCIGTADVTKEDTTIEHMESLEAILTDHEFSEDNAEMMAAAAAEMEAITGETYELNGEVNVTPTPEIEYKIVGITVSQGSTDITEGTSEVLVTIQGGEDYDTLTEIEVFVNNVSLGTYPAEYQIENKIECNIIGSWNVRVDGTFTDDTTQTLIDTSGFELRELEDAPDAGALGERYIEVDDGAMTRAEAKALCDELGIVWGDERDC